MKWRCGRFEFPFPRPALVMGIVNVTPDSFADGGRYFEAEAAVARGLELVGQGADLLDVGGESTRPNATPVEEAEELRRVLPVIGRLAETVSVPISIDTQKPAVARAALAAGASIANDISANRADEGMARLIARTGAGYVCMHMQGTPQTMQVAPVYGDVVEEIGGFFEARLTWLQASGVSAEQVVLDVGIGFGKTVEHNLQLLGNLKRFRSYGRPLLVGLSRKSFIGKLVGAEAEDRLPGSIAGACWALLAGTQILRVHDVAETRQALRVLEAIVGSAQPQV